MPRLYHPTFKEVHVEVDESRVAEHVAAGWVDKRRKPAPKTESEPKRKTRKRA